MGIGKALPLIPYKTIEKGLCTRYNKDHCRIESLVRGWSNAGNEENDQETGATASAS